jgi:hypothetical protein
MEDQQVTAGLARYLETKGCRTLLTKPEQIVWRNRLAYLETSGYRGPVGAVVRFYQGEWLARFPQSLGWSNYFIGGATPVTNPGGAILSESKRLPLAWLELESDFPTWRSLLPETRDPREVPWDSDDSWIIKTAYGNAGDSVHARDWASPEVWRRAVASVRRNGERWVAQRRFDTHPLDTPDGRFFPCLGVYVVEGRTAGIYGRLSKNSKVDSTARDVAVLLKEE